MGGGGSKPKSNKLETNLVLTKFPKADSAYEKANKSLKDAETIRVGVEESKKKAIELAKTDWVKGDDNLRFREAIRVLLWTVSAETQGRLGSAFPKATNDPPTFELNITGRSVEATNLYSAISSYIKAAATAQLFSDAIPVVESTLKTSKDVKKMLKQEKGAGLDAKKQAAAGKISQDNTKILERNLPKLKIVAPVAKASNTAVKAYKLQDLLNFNYDDIGRKAAAENVRTPHAIFDKYYPDKKLTPQEFDAEYNKGKKNNKKNDKNKKPDPKPAQPTTTTTNPNLNANINGQVVYGDSPFNNPGLLGQNSPFSTPQKGKAQDEDVFDDEENRGPIIKNVQDSNLLHQSSIKRQKYIKPVI
jgi:hypothetical protein